MKEYIERAKVLESLGYEENRRGDVLPGSTFDIILKEPAADVVEVRHGRWGEYESFPLTSSLNGHPCSECGMHFSTLAIPVMKYCPNCGALMREVGSGEK